MWLDILAKKGDTNLNSQPACCLIIDRCASLAVHS